MTATVDTEQFYDDPLAPVSAQFPLTRPGLATVDNTDAPSAPETRPFGLRNVRAMPEPIVPPYEYSHDQQVSVSDDDSETPMVKLSPNMEWSSITDNDGDEGPSEDWGNDFAPDHPVQV
ncbi:putative ATP-grasp target RiPP [Herbihabitans rhizosphaerae]|uniref:Putative ATP-grasp target RiPP n=1 Tax=Herbihabitans rhizosphaerae TaxID=1872711 RepID=A0A4Q7KN71_9PSEU|nr:hypothetical protein [Herbihabitans rhizosphaerae]RZS37814.1 putative ATP-grasp target RiPP [Herbihabitans rhizosphaerae]